MNGILRPGHGLGAELPSKEIAYLAVQQGIEFTTRADPMAR